MKIPPLAKSEVAIFNTLWPTGTFCPCHLCSCDLGYATLKTLLSRRNKNGSTDLKVETAAWLFWESLPLDTQAKRQFPLLTEIICLNYQAEMWWSKGGIWGQRGKYALTRETFVPWVCQQVSCHIWHLQCPRESGNYTTQRDGQDLLYLLSAYKDVSFHPGEWIYELPYLFYIELIICFPQDWLGYAASTDNPRISVA